MAKCSAAQMEALKKQLQAKAAPAAQKALFEDCCRELAARFLAKAIKRTPVGTGTFEVVKDDEGKPAKYQRGKKKGQVKLQRLTNGGTLRRGWTCDTESAAASGGGGDAMSRAAGLPVACGGGVYSIVVSNPVHYASYVEYGHKQEAGRYIPALGKRLKQTWVRGQFMATKAAEEVNAEKDSILAARLADFLKGGK